MGKAFLLAAAGVLFLGTMNTAAALESTYGSAGCGFGSMIFGSKEGFVQVLAATTNGCFASQSFGITFGTLNCGASALDSVGARVFIEANREALAKDIARGSGETISSLSTIAGCADEYAVGAALQEDFSSIFPDESVSSEAVEDSILNTLTDPTLQCHEVG